MVDGVIPILGLSPEKQLRTFVQTVDGKVVQVEAVTHVDPTNADAIQAVDETPKAVA